MNKYVKNISVREYFRKAVEEAMQHFGIDNPGDLEVEAELTLEELIIVVTEAPKPNGK